MNTAIKYDVRNPYPGLRPFRVEEKHLFFGREEQVDRMVEKLEARRFLAVVGGSGSGKSSLVNCGLRPALHRGNMASAGSNWKMIQIRPGSDPIGNLAQALAKPDVLFRDHTSSVVSLQELVITTLRLGSLGLVDAIDQADLPADTKVLVIVDQFEELFRFRALAKSERKDHFNSAEDAVTFVHLLLEAITQTAVPIYVVITMRSDFLGECAQFCGLPEAINESQYLVPRLSRCEIRAAVTGPAALRGVSLSPVLIARLLNDVGDNPDQLSILQHALNRTWAYMEKSNDPQDTLELHHYEVAGGMELALDRHAERAFGELTTADEQRLCEQIFKVLTDIGTDARGVRRPTRLATLAEITGAPEEKLVAVINVFRKPSRSFLMPPSVETLAPQTPIDISHESLMRVWKRLKNWADDEARSARTFARLRDAAEDFHTFQANEWRGSQLRSINEWYEKNTPTHAWAQLYGGGYEKAMAFLDASNKKEDDENYKAKLEVRWKVWKRCLNVAIFIVFMVSFFWIKDSFEKLPASFNASFSSFLSEHLGDRKLKDLDEANIIKDNLIARSNDVLALMLASMLVMVVYISVVPFAKNNFSTWENWWRSKSTELVGLSQSIVGTLSLIFSYRIARVDVEAHGYASFGRRAAAELIDWIVCWFGSMAITFAIIFTENYLEPNDSILFYLIYTLPLLFYALYHILFWSSKWQATLGMRSVGIIITSKAGYRLGLGRATIRFFARWLSYFTALFGFLMALFNQKKQTLHDKIAGTVVVHRQAKIHDVVAAAGDIK